MYVHHLLTVGNTQITIQLYMLQTMMAKQTTKTSTRTRVIGRIRKTICILLLIFFYKITIHQYLYSYTYASLKQILHEWSKELDVNGDEKFCLLQNPFFSKVDKNRTSCSSCESIREISEIYRTSFDEIELLSIYQNQPVLVTDVMFDWQQFNRMDEYYLNQVITIWKQTSSHKFQSCYYATNIRHLSNSIVDYWRIISNPVSDNWFFAWKNCNLDATKYFRHLYSAPYFIKYYLPAPEVSWIIMSSNYKSNLYKQLPLQQSKLLVLMQLKGALHYKLQVQECRNICNNVEGILKESMTLVFNSDVWDFQYLLHQEGINMAIILEYSV